MLTRSLFAYQMGSRPQACPPDGPICAGFLRFLLLRRARRCAILRRFARVQPGRTDPPVLVVVGHALLGEPDHLVERAGSACVPHALDADILVVARVVDLVELVPAAELGADRVPRSFMILMRS